MKSLNVFDFVISPVDPNAAREVTADVLAKTGATLIDAPVSGGVGGAEAGTLTFMVGGTQADFDRASVLLKCMGKNVRLFFCVLYITFF